MWSDRSIIASFGITDFDSADDIFDPVGIDPRPRQGETWLFTSSVHRAFAVPGANCTRLALRSFTITPSVLDLPGFRL